jgi:UDP-N-acetylmuramoyl-tripeptide--D-alanyl-D-alanine ligase
VRARTLADVAAAVGGSTRDGDVVVTSLSTDSRTVEPGALFVAIHGERADGHDHIAEAIARGAAGSLVDREVDGPSVRVRDTVRALLDLASDERRATGDVRLLAITGANGKTSTKDLAAGVLATRFRTHASPRSFNNEIGLPVTLLDAPAGAEVIVAEMGARRRGDVALLCRVARPDVVVVTNVGVAHMEIFGSWDAIVQASAEPVDALEADGTAVLNADDPIVRGYRDRTAARVLTFGVAQDADVRAEAIVLDGEGRASFDLVSADGREPVELSVAGEHMVSNALAAAAGAIALGVDPAECAAALKDVRASEWRMEVFSNADGVVVVNDAYNANPESMAAGLRAARWIARQGRMVAVLGHMAELGDIASDEHERLGELLVRLGVDRIVTVGDPARAIARAAVREGALPEDVASYGDIDQAVADVRSWAVRGDVVLVKGSRVVGLERVAEALR